MKKLLRFQGKIGILKAPLYCSGVSGRDLKTDDVHQSALEEVYFSLCVILHSSLPHVQRDW